MVPASEERLYLDAVLEPHRSLSRRGVWLIMAPLIAVNLLFGLVFWWLGGVFVPPFLGLDVLGMALALWFSFRQTGRSERVRVSADQVTVTHEGRGRARTVWVSAPQFTRVALDGPEARYGRLRLWSKGCGVALGADLGAPQRRRFAAELEAALVLARAERWPALAPQDP